MRCLAVLLLAGCASSGPTVDANEGGTPFAFVAAGFPDRPETPPMTGSMPLTMRFIFTNVTDRPYTIERLSIRQGPRGTTRVQFEPGSTRVNRMIDPGEDVEIDVQLNTMRGRPQAGEPPNYPVHVEAQLILLDGTRYRYAVAIGFEW